MDTDIKNKLSEDTAKEVWEDKAIVEIKPNHLGKSGTFYDKLMLYIGSEYCGMFPTYTQTLEHAIWIINKVNFEED